MTEPKKKKGQRESGPDRAYKAVRLEDDLLQN